MRGPKPTVVVAGLGDTGVLVATRLSRSCRVIGISTRPALVSGQELGTRLIDLPRWKRTYLVPYRRFRRLDAIEFVHGRITSTDMANSTVTVASVDGRTRQVAYDAFVIATGVSNGFWRHDRLEDLAAIDSSMAAVNEQLADASIIAVVGGGATGVSVADNLARRGDATVHLFHSGTEPLPDFHPDVRRWILRRLAADGVEVQLDRHTRLLRLALFERAAVKLRQNVVRRHRCLLLGRPRRRSARRVVRG